MGGSTLEVLSDSGMVYIGLWEVLGSGRYVNRSRGHLRAYFHVQKVVSGRS